MICKGCDSALLTQLPLTNHSLISFGVIKQKNTMQNNCAEKHWFLNTEFYMEFK